MAVTHIDELRDIITGHVKKRYKGKFFAKCHELAGVMEATNIEIIVCEVAGRNDLDQFIFQSLKTVFKDHGLECEVVGDHEIRCGNKRIFFLCKDQICEDKTEGVEWFYHLSMDFKK